MPTTRKKVIKTVYKDEDESEGDNSVGDFSDSGSEAEIPDAPSSDEEEEASDASADEFDDKSKKTFPGATVVKKKFAKELINKINRQSSTGELPATASISLFTVQDLTEEDKLLPSVLNLSESDSSDDEAQKAPTKKPPHVSHLPYRFNQDSDSDKETPMEYKDVWSDNIKDNSEEVAKQTFMELEQHKTQLEETKATLLKYKSSKQGQVVESDVKDLLALGEEVLPEQTVQPVLKKGRKGKKVKDDSDSEIEDWEEVKEAKTIPQQGLQLIVDFPDATCRKSKKIDVEMMMRRKINRVKKEYQVYMHKVHVLCWLGHGNYVSRVLNDQEVLTAVLSLVPSKECYPGERVDMKYLEHITTWYRDKFTLKQDKNEDKFRPKAPPLKDTLVAQTKTKVVTTKKYLVFIFVSMLRALGLQSRVMFNFTTVPIKPPSSELCSLSTKQINDKKSLKEKDTDVKPGVKKTSKSKVKKIPQLDGNNDSISSDDDTDFSDIIQLDGKDDVTAAKTRNTRVRSANKNLKTSTEVKTELEVSPPKRVRKSSPQNQKQNKNVEDVKGKSKTLEPEKRKRATKKNVTEDNKSTSNITEDKAPPRKLPNRRQNKTNDKDKSEKMDIDTQPEKTSEFCSPSLIKTNTPTKSKSMVQNNKNTVTKDKTPVVDEDKIRKMEIDEQNATAFQKPTKTSTNRSLRSNKNQAKPKISTECKSEDNKLNPPQIIVTQHESKESVSSKYFETEKSTLTKKLSLTRNRSQTANPSTSQKQDETKPKARTRSVPGKSVEKETSKYFEEKAPEVKKGRTVRKREPEEDKKRVSHRDLLAKNKTKQKNDITGDLVNIIKKRVKEAKQESKKGKVKVMESDEDSDHLPEEPIRRKSDSDDDFKPCKISPKPSSSKKIDRRVLSSDTEELPKNKCDIWCEVFVEELEQWIAVDVLRGKVHCTNELYNRATHPVCYIVGWDNNNYLKDLTRRYVPHWNTVTRKQRAEPLWWDTAVKPWLGPRTARDREEDDQLDRMLLDAPYPNTISEYKNHPLYALKRHLLKYEVIYPPDARTLTFVKGEAVYARECVYVCRSRDTWLKEAKVVKLGEQPYKIVKARPKWDRLSNKLITDKPLEVFGPWQTMDYEPPQAENGIVPRNAYGNVELFKDCMLPKGTVHIKLPGLNRVTKKLNIDCAPAMTGFDFNGGWSHPVYDGFVVCKEFEDIVIEAWHKDQEEQERRERDKTESRVYGNWRRLIKGLLIRERLKNKYGFEEPPADPANKKKEKGPKLVVKKK